MIRLRLIGGLFLSGNTGVTNAGLVVFLCLVIVYLVMTALERRLDEFSRI